MQQLYLSGKLKTNDTLNWSFYKIFDCLIKNPEKLIKKMLININEFLFLNKN